MVADLYAWEVPVAAVPVGGGAAPPLAVKVDMTVQELSNWCWAACTQAVIRTATDEDVDQCVVAGLVLHDRGETATAAVCCTEHTNASPCNRPFYLDVALGFFHRLLRFEPQPVTPAQARAELAKGRPIACHIRWGTTGSGHFVIIGGILEDDTLLVHDPLMHDGTESSRVAFAVFASQYRDGTGIWGGTYFVK